MTLGVVMTVQDLEQAVAEFNRYSGEYRVEIVDYFSQAESYEDASDRLSLDIVTGKAPDIIALSGIDYSMFCEKGGWQICMSSCGRTRTSHGTCWCSLW